jgi:hypothetical protein
MTWGWLKYAALGVAALFVLWLVAGGIYDAGYGKAQAEGVAALAELKREYSDANVARWEEYAAKLQEARRETQNKQAKADALEAELLDAKTALVNERRGFAKRIADATRNNDAHLDADVVRLFNEALYGPGWAARAGSEHGAAGASGLAQSAGAPAPSGAGLLREQLVSMKDLLAHAKLYGEWAREVYTIALGWNALVPE